MNKLQAAIHTSVSTLLDRSDQHANTVRKGVARLVAMQQEENGGDNNNEWIQPAKKRLKTMLHHAVRPLGTAIQQCQDNTTYQICS